MDQESIVYGCIKDELGRQVSQRRKINRDAMLALPEADQWTFLSRTMFSIPSSRFESGNYHSEVMHFGASYRAVEYEWESWIKEFEALLARMYWVSAVVHLETELSGTHTFAWDSAGSCHEPGSGNIQVRCEWQHEAAIL